MFKKLLSIVLATILMLTFSVSALAQSSSSTLNVFLDEKGTYTTVGSNMRSSAEVVSIKESGGGIYEDLSGTRYFSEVAENRFFEVGKVQVNINSLGNIQQVAAKYNLSTATVNRLKNAYNKNLLGKYTIESVEVFTPNALNARSSRRYVGYRNATYYEEIVLTKGLSDTVTVFQDERDAFNANMSERYSEILTFVTDTGIDYVTKGTYSLLSLGFKLHPASVEIGSPDSLRATMQNSYYEKITMFCEGSEEYMGSVTAKGTYYFEDTVRNGIKGQTKILLTPTRSFNTANYNTADKLAYNNYQNGGYGERAEEVEHFNVMFSMW